MALNMIEPPVIRYAAVDTLVEHLRYLCEMALADDTDEVIKTVNDIQKQLRYSAKSEAQRQELTDAALKKSLRPEVEYDEDSKLDLSAVPDDTPVVWETHFSIPVDFDPAALVPVSMFELLEVAA